jgi:hypothetical protein
MKTPDYMNYSRYKKNKKKNNKKSTAIFIATFCGMLLFFIGAARILSPDVDINIGNDPDYEAKDTGLGVKKFIDSRLKMIQNDDNGQSVQTQGTGSRDSYNVNVGSSFGDGTSSSSNSKRNRKTRDYNDASFDNYSTTGMEEPINKKKSSSYSNDSDMNEFGTSSNSQPVRRAPQRPQARVSTPVSSSRSKVYVGYYSNAQQAKVAQGILQDAGLGVSPTVRNSGGGYTLQIGSYGSRSRAEGVASQLQRSNFPARVVQEQ